MIQGKLQLDLIRLILILPSLPTEGKGVREHNPLSFDFLCQYCVCGLSQSCPTLCSLMDYSPPGSSIHRDSPEKNPGVGCHALLQGIFSTQGSNPGLPVLQVDSLPSEHQGSPLSILAALNMLIACLDKKKSSSK